MHRDSSSGVLRKQLVFVLALALAVIGIAVPDSAVTAEEIPPTEESQENGSELGAQDDGWLVDEETGRRYKVEELPRVEGTYKWIGEGQKRVRVPGGVTFDLAGFDDKKFQVKVWEQVKIERKPREVPQGPTPEEIAANYRQEVDTVDRLRFEDLSDGLPRAGQWRNGFDLADMNGDGHLDIVFGPARKGRPIPNVFLHDGKGSWERWRADFPELAYDYGDAEVGDWNGDGKPDIAFGVHLRGILAIASDGESGFKPYREGIGFDIPGQGGDATSYSSRAILGIDWDRDGLEDIIALGEGPKGMRTGPGAAASGVGRLIDTSRGLLLYRNNGDGSWTSRQLDPSEPELGYEFGSVLKVGDFNRDGRTDLVIATQRMGSQRVLALQTEEGGVEIHSVEALRPRAFIGGVAVGDLNSDGRDDLVFGYLNREDIWRTSLDLLVAGDDLTWTRHSVISIDDRKGLYGLTIGDLDRDGNNDIVALTGDGEVLAFLGDGKGDFVLEESPELPKPEPGCKGFESRLADLDGDGSPELVAGFAGEPTGIPVVPATYRAGCAREGSLKVWKLQLADADSAD